MRAHRVRGNLFAWLAATALLAACAAPAAPPIGPSGGAATPAPGGVVRDFRLTAAATILRLGLGVQVRAWTYNGSSPGPELRATVGDVLRVRLLNRLLVGTTIHWHGLDVPNGEDGVAGVTQDSIPPGGSALYSFRLTHSGTYWYHSHQDSAVQVDRGLYGALVVLPRHPEARGLDRTLVYDEWPMGLEEGRSPPQADPAMRSYITTTVNGRTASAIEPIGTTAGETVRLRLINAGYLKHYLEASIPVTIAALDGHELTGGSPIVDAVPLGPGERVDLLMTAPERAFTLRLIGAFPPDRDATQQFAPGGGGAPMPDLSSHRLLDLLAYSGVATDDPLTGGWKADRTFTLNLSEVTGKEASATGAMAGMSGMDGIRYEVDGTTFPATPVLSVTRGEIAEMTFRNQGTQEHWMHLHGHFFRVLARDGTVLPGRLVKDTVSVPSGHSVTIVFRADKPGWWMIHCHQLLHSAGGMMVLLAYQGSRRPAALGGPYFNSPD